MPEKRVLENKMHSAVLSAMLLLCQLVSSQGDGNHVRYFKQRKFNTGNNLNRPWRIEKAE